MASNAEPQDIPSLIEQQRSFFASGNTRPLKVRIQALKTLKRTLQENEAALYEAISKDFGKSEFDTYTTELALVYHDIDRALANIERWNEPRRVSTRLLNFPGRSYIVPEPLGVCLVIGAWNYPYQLSLAPIVPALAAGNTVIIKPSELPAKSSRVMANILGDAFDARHVAVVEGSVAETSALLNERFDKIFFTGSEKVGRIVYKAAAEHLTPVTLELGGKSPAFVSADCALEMTCKRLVWAKFLNAGQTCIAPDYILVEDRIADRFVATMIKAIKRAKLSLEHDNYVQIINHRNYERLEELIDANKIAYQGEANKATRLFPPTLLFPAAWEDKSMQDEIFGPILPIIPYTDLDKAMAQVQSRPKPLSAYVFSKNKQVKQRVMRDLSFGGGGINEAVMHIADDNLPFGGVGSSGIGKYHGESGFEVFSHQKAVLDKPTWFEAPLKYYPLTKKKLKWITWVMRQ